MSAGERKEESGEKGGINAAFLFCMLPKSV